MLNFIFGVFLLLHGLVHLLYFGQSWRLFELRPGMIWPDGSWAFSKLFGDQATRILASIFCLLAAIGFVAGGLGLLLNQPWSRSVVLASAVFSTLIFILFWNRESQTPGAKGAIGILINLTILVILLI